MPRTFLMTEQGHLFKGGSDMIVKTQTLSRVVLMGVALCIGYIQLRFEVFSEKCGTPTLSTKQFSQLLFQCE